jgi:ABC-type oligopeptide transport system substrate-binding subunit/class 3 adenylate cyclase
MVEREQLERAIATLEAQRATLGDAVVEAALASMRERLAALERAESPALKLQGERKLVTVVFADLSGFTALSETMDPEAVRDLMNGCFEWLVPIIEKYGGTVDKFIGDEIMALFGAPVTHENDPERALRAALEMRGVLAAFNADRGTDLAVHFGINTGLVIAGGIGTRGRQAYSVMGDAVNLAWRLKEISGRGGILVGPDTHRLTAPLFEFEPLTPIRVKGKAELVQAYRLLASKVVPGKLRGVAGLDSPLVGREVEFRALQVAMQRLQSGEGSVVTLVGEAGLGKSRLVAELRRESANRKISKSANQRVSTSADLRTSRSADVNWIEGRCLSYGASIAYLLWLDVLRGLLEVTIEDPPVAVRDALQERVRTLCPEYVGEVYPYLGRLMSLPLESEIEAVVHDLEGEGLKTSTFHAVETLIEGAARRCSLVVICEDLHWADPTSIELLEHLLALVDRVPLLFICVFRPEREQGCWNVRRAVAQRYRHRHVDLFLKPLSTAESETLVSNLLPMGNLPRGLRRRILGRAEGNPFYVEEIIRSLMDSGAIVWDASAGRWRAIRDVDDIAIPGTLHGVLMARVDRLQEEAKRVLQLAAVVGRIFLYRVLAAIAQEERRPDDPELWDHLLTLQQEEMIRERARIPELEYIFKHHLTQEVAYNSLLKRERRAFHRQVAKTLERLFPDRIEEQIGLLAHHWERAEEPEKAAEYLSRAGDQARLAYAHEEAIDYYRRALAFLREGGEHEQAARTLMKLALTHHTAFDFRRARRAYEEGFALWQQAGEVQSAVPPPLAPHALRVGWGDPQTLDPTLAYSVFSRAVIEQLFSGLVELSPRMDVVPDVARTWEVLEDGRKYVFHLRDDVRWSDGTPVTAGDFEYAWKRILDPATGSVNASLLYDVKGARAFHQGEISDPDHVGVRALDEVTLVVELEGPTGYALQLLACPVSYPVPRHVVEAYGEAWAEVGNVVTNGLFRLETWRPSHSMLLVRNPDYHGRFPGNVQRVELSLFSEWSAGLELYQADALDVLRVPASELDWVRRRYAGEYVSEPLLQTRWVGINASRPPFDDRRVRRAFVLAADRETLADVTLGGFALPATGGLVPPGMPAHSAGSALPYDPDRARQLLAEVGYPGGRGFPVVDMLTPHSGTGRDADLASAYLQAQWRENLGAEVNCQMMEWEVFLDRMDKEPPHLFSMGWRADYPDPDTFLRVGVNDVWQWRNETYDRIVGEARRVTDQGERMKLYAQADGMLVEEAAIMPLTYGQSHLLVKPWVKKYPALPIKAWFWKDVIIEPH